MLHPLLGSQVPIEQSFFRIPRISARIAGFWPQPAVRPRTWLTVLRFCVNTFAVAVGGFGEVTYGFFYLYDLFSALEAFCPGVTKVISLLKMTIFFGRHERWQRVIHGLHTLLLLDTSAGKRRIMEPLASFASVLSFVLLASGSLTNTFFNVLPLLKMAYFKWRALDMQLLLPFNVILPEVLVNLPYYPATYLVLTLSGAMTVFTFSAVDGFFLCACVYATALFRILQHDIRNAFAELQEPYASSSRRFGHTIHVKSDISQVESSVEIGDKGGLRPKQAQSKSGIFFKRQLLGSTVFRPSTASLE
ncbi:unnamed protein product [Ceratitis capitata]|uniref:(Mediterranean fruit fly) hypothetical protein n=1 Tax=Ceratitis capitata TaxID=7213 RepID=A0A811UQD5_CERCA|nr:unnamed protein product [Ceratitis capitata]